MGTIELEQKVCCKENLPSMYSATNKTNNWINRVKEIHKDRYDYSKVEYVNNRTKIKIICPEHGLFEQSPMNHLQENSCPKCAIELKGWSDKEWEQRVLQSKNFNSFKVYIIKCWNEEKNFTK